MQVFAARRLGGICALFAAALGSGCAGEADETSNGPVYAEPVSPFEACPAPLGAPEDLAATPRADENLEFLALVLEPDGLVATQANYDRVVADVGAIRELVPVLAPIEYRPLHDGRSVLVTFDEVGLDALEDGSFGAWECLNEALGASVGPVVDIFPTYSPLLTLRGVHNMPRVKQFYEQLPGISSADIYGARTLGSTWCIGSTGEHHEYVIDRAINCGSDCEGQEHEAHHFSSETPGEVTSLEVWRSADGAAPAWYTQLCR